VTSSISAPPSALLLLDWYAHHRRVLPWRALPGQAPDPYHIWLSEIMLQQTVVATVIPYYQRFLDTYPTVEALAAAPLDDILALWAGLGYYARGRNLHACAKDVAALGGFPRDVAALRQLPGIGPYTANAIAAIAFGVPVLPVDGNVERVTARLFAITTPVPAAKPALAQAAARLLDDPAAAAAPSDFAQALFDLGATICAPKTPRCLACPWVRQCAAHKAGIAASLPARTKKPAKPHRTGTAYALIDAAGDILLIRRPPSGLLGGMLSLPETPPATAQWQQAGDVQHVFTHFSLTLTVQVARTKTLPEAALRAPAATAPLPSLMRKALDAALVRLKDTS
jgi:A/G-specific adenine glycosylase